MNHLLYPITFPKHAKDNLLYFSGEQFSINSNHCEIEKNGFIRFQSPFNVINVSQWLHYTTIDSIIVSLKVSGHGRISIHAETEHDNVLIKEFDFHEPKESDLFEKIDFQQYPDSIIYIKVDALEKVTLFSGAYYTDQEVFNFPEIDLVICTYKREEFVNKTLEQVLYFLKSESLSWNVFVIDNGNTLNQADFPQVRIIANLNWGGSGGFARGMLESIKNGKASHLLLMDDDIEVPDVSLYLLLSTLRYLRKEFEQEFLPAAMYSFSDRLTQTVWLENTSIGKETKVFDNQQNLETLRGYESQIRHKDAPITCSWWMCCIPVSYILKYGLPLPYFLKWDDAEFSMRQEGHFQPVMILGFSVWHFDFTGKMSNIMNYYRIRNEIYTRLFHGSFRFAKELKKIREILSAIRRKQPMRNNVMIKYFSYRDVNKGFEWFLNHDRIVNHDCRINEMNKVKGFGIYAKYFFSLFVLFLKTKKLKKEFIKGHQKACSIEYWQNKLIK